MFKCNCMTLYTDLFKSLHFRHKHHLNYLTLLTSVGRFNSEYTFFLASTVLDIRLWERGQIIHATLQKTKDVERTANDACLLCVCQHCLLMSQTLA